MTPNELRRQLEAMKISQRQLARNLNLTERTVRHYCAGSYSIPRPVILAVRYLMEHPEEVYP